MSNNQLICVKKPDPGLSEIFEEMYVSERLVDVTLSCANGQLQAHKLVLAACSTYFSSLFDKLTNPFHYPVIVIKDMQIDDLRLIVDFMYRGQITVSQEKLMSIVKSAENLQISGLSNLDGLITSPAEGSTSNGSKQTNNNHQRFKRNKRTTSSSSSGHGAFNRTYQQSRLGDLDDRGNIRPDKLLEQSMATGESLDGVSHQFNYANNDPTSTRNINSNQDIHNLTPSLQISHLAIEHQQHHNNDNNNHHHQQQHHQQQQLTSQLQVLSHSLAANRTSMANFSNSNGQSSNQSSSHQQHSRGRLHHCSICYKTFREKANLKRHLQVHSLDRVTYACPDCNKTFSWKDNYIRHTKTTHHINNSRSQI